MKRIFQNLGVPAVLAAAIGFAGCLGDSNPSSPANTDDTGNEFENLDLSSENGGYTQDTESPNFGDPILLKIKNEEEDALDGGLVDEASLEASPSFDVHFLRIVWGVLDDDSTNTVATDWSGSISLLRGAVKVQRVIRFERPGDSIVRPDGNRREINFTSTTSVDHDGLLLRIYTPKDDADPIPNTITLTTGPLTKSYEIAQLDGLSEVIDVDALGNQVSFLSRARAALPCGNGYMRGYWRMNGESNRGAFGGVWVEADGRPAGFMRGHFGEKEDGTRVLFGKYISASGDFRGILRGTYTLDGLGGGAFEGMWIGRGGRLDGEFKGAFQVGERLGMKSGSFEGAWSANCEGDTGLTEGLSF
ncbi:MAG: hypothetical protein ACKVU1_15565 [bacterium]